MKILYCGMYREKSGYSEAITNNILALEKVGVDVYARPLQYNTSHKTPDKILHLENKISDNYDFLVQHIPPYCMEYVKQSGINIGVFYAETDNLPLSWIARLNYMDLNIVPNHQLKNQLNRCVKPTEVVHIPTDIEKYNKKYNIYKDLLPFRKRKSFLFYTVGEYAKRKNFSGLLKAYFTEFNAGEPVGLVIKTSISGLDSEECMKVLYNDIELIKKGLKVQNTPDIFVITERLSEEELMSIHYHSDCFVQPSYGESWSIPAFDAMGFGKYPIVTDDGGYKEYIDSSVGFLIPARKNLVFGEGEIHSELFTGKNLWSEPDLLILKKQMREVYSNQEMLKSVKENSKNKINLFSYEKIGSELKKVLKKWEEKLKK